MKLSYPVKGVEKFITQKYGERPEYYSQFKIGGVPLKGHEGVDLRAPTGTEIVACDSGFCQEVIDQGKVGYGKYIKIIHSWGESVYAHLKEFKIKQGDEVKKDQVIGLADNTGNSSGSHLHLGIRINPYDRADGWGGYSNPEPYIFYEEEIMPNWAKNLQPFFTENNLKDEQVEASVREAFGARKILQGFIEKWASKFQCDIDLSKIEGEIQKLLDMEDEHTDLVSACELITGHYETEKALRDALRAVKTDLDELSKSRQALIEEVELLKKKKVLDRYEWWQLLKEGFVKLLLKIGGVFKYGKN